MRPKLLLLVCVALASTLFASQGAMAADLDGLINIDDYDPADSKKADSNSKPVDRLDGEGDDEEYSGVQSDESGSGSGDENTTDPSVDVSVMSPTPEQTSATSEGETTTEISNVITEDTEEPTKDPDNNVDGVDGDETRDGDMFGGGVGVKDSSSDKSPNAEANIDDEPAEKKVLRVLTTEVIAAVVVGAVCAVILIAFLVYRLRKRDEGSYALGDAGYKDTYKLHGDTGKEAFV